jgi:predicted nucleotidyltransferase
VTLTKEKITRVLHENLPYLASEYGVKRIGLFGFLCERYAPRVKRR